MTHMMPESRCPRCGRIISAAGEAHGTNHIPSPGDFSICFGCCGILVFKDDLTVRAPTKLEEIQAMTHDELQLVRRKLIGFKKHFEL